MVLFSYLTHHDSACDRYNLELVRRTSSTFKAAIRFLGDGSFKIQTAILWVPDVEPSGIKLGQYENIICLSVNYIIFSFIVIQIWK